jgi:hypothetical protein
MRAFRIFLVLAVLLSVNLVSAQFYNGSHQRFGKNRVQFQGFKWQYYDFERFKVYFNGDGKNVAVYAARSAHQQLKQLEEYMNFRIDDKLEIVVYNRHSDFKQSNIGLVGDEEANIGGVNKLVGNKVFVYFDGNHANFDKEIRYGLVQVMISQMIHGANWKNFLRTPMADIMPFWFVEGFARHIAYGWSPEMDDKVRNATSADLFLKFNHLEGEEAALAGHAFWNYIAEKYGDRPIPNLFYISSSARSVENGLYIVMNMSLLGVANDMVRYYRERYAQDKNVTKAPTEEEIQVKLKKKARIYGYRLSPDGTRLAYVSNIMGRYRVHVKDLSTGKQKVIFRAEHRMERQPDESFPVLAWNPRLNTLAFAIERKGFLKIMLKDFDNNEMSSLDMKGLTKIRDLNYSADGRVLLFSGVANGQSDIFTYTPISNSLRNLTNDSFDDFSPSFIGNSNKIIFSSNRPYDSIPRRESIEAFKPEKRTFDIFILDPGGPGGRIIVSRITETPEENELSPYAYGKNTYSFISDRNGILNRQIAYYDSAISYIDTAIHYKYFSKTAPLSNYNHNAYDFHVIPSGRIWQYGFLTWSDSKYRFYRGESSADKPIEDAQLPTTEYRRISKGIRKTVGQEQKSQSATSNTIIVEQDLNDPDEIDLDNYQFDDEKPQYEKVIVNLEKEAEKTNEAVAKKNEEKAAEFELPDQKLYKKNFVWETVTAQFDNNLLNETYQRFVAPGAVFPNPGISPIFRANLTDVFEDNKLSAGFRLGGDLRSNEFVIQYDDISGRIDHRIVGYRGSFLTVFGANRVRARTSELRYQATYPFSEHLAFKATGGYRHDQQIFLASSGANLNEDNRNFHQATARAELVFDNTISRGLNLPNGARFKLFGEYFKELNGDQANIFIVGGDFRHYQKVHRQIVWANRIAFSSSFGDKKLLHYLGGVDNWIFRRNPSFDQTFQVDMAQNYAFQTIATPMRGFVQNARNGNTFALINSELRVPLVRCFTNRPLRSDFWNTFQLIGFFDAGAAWNGVHPYASNNSFNTIVIDQKPLLIEIENQREPIIWGYGIGVRARVSGYFVRFDWAWGVDDYERQRSIRYLSLTLDF